MKKYITIVALLLSVSAFLSDIHAEWNDSIRYNASAEADFSIGRHTPFWMVSNRQGLSSVKRQNGYVRAGVFHDMDSTRRFTWGAGVDLAAGWNLTAPFRVQQLYGEVRYRCLNLLIGQKELWGLYNDPLLSSGNIMYSGNSAPIPQIRAGMFDYQPVWGCKGWFSLKGYIAFGKFTDSDWQYSFSQSDIHRSTDVLYHSKGIWFKFGNEQKFPLTYEFGLEMATQFGGTVYYDGVKYNISHGLKDWFKAIVPLHGSNPSLSGEVTNIQGNMLGTWYTCIGWHPSADWSMTGYYEHFFEDHSMMFWEYPWKDGMWGIKVTLPDNRYVSSFVYEFLYAKDQGGAVYNDRTPQVPEQVSGRDSYYNHYLYPGWQHWGMGIGNPLSISPVYNSGGSLMFSSTRIIGNHLGISGNPAARISYRILASHTLSWGTYGYPSEEVLHNISLYGEAIWRPKWIAGLETALAIAGDCGDMIGNNAGVMLRISKTGWLFKSRK